MIYCTYKKSYIYIQLYDMYVYLDMETINKRFISIDTLINVIKTTINHPPVFTIFIGAMNHSQSWVVYGIVWTTFIKVTIHGLIQSSSIIQKNHPHENITFLMIHFWMMKFIDSSRTIGSPGDYSIHGWDVIEVSPWDPRTLRPPKKALPWWRAKPWVGAR